MLRNIILLSCMILCIARADNLSTDALTIEGKFTFNGAELTWEEFKPFVKLAFLEKLTNQASESKQSFVSAARQCQSQLQKDVVQQGVVFHKRGFTEEQVMQLINAIFATI